MDSFDICTTRSDVAQLAAALKSSFLILATHVLAGEVDTCLDGSAVHARLFWLLRYYNPINLAWRYYSILAFRLSSSDTWSPHHLAIVNSEPHPFQPPLPYAAVNAAAFPVLRLDPPSALTSHSVLTLSAAFQGLLALHYTLSNPKGIPSLANLTMPFAVLGLLRVLVFPWITGKVYVSPFPYPADFDNRSSAVRPIRAAAAAWAALLATLLFFSFWPSRFFVDFTLGRPVRQHRVLSLCVQVLYQYCAASAACFHGVFLIRGALAWGNRIPMFDHWAYKAQTLGLVLVIAFTFGVAVLDFVDNDFYQQCTPK